MCAEKSGFLSVRLEDYLKMTARCRAKLQGWCLAVWSFTKRAKKKIKNKKPEQAAQSLL